MVHVEHSSAGQDSTAATAAAASPAAAAAPPAAAAEEAPAGQDTSKEDLPPADGAEGVEAQTFCGVGL